MLSGAQGVGYHCNPFPHPLASASEVTGKGIHLNRFTSPSNQGLLSSCKLHGPECCPSQILLGNQPWASLPETGIWQCLKGLSAKGWGQESKSGERTTVDCMDTTEGKGVRGSATRNAHRGSVICLGNEAPLLSARARAATSPTCQPLLSWALGETPNKVTAPQSVATVCWSPLPPGTPQL